MAKRTFPWLAIIGLLLNPLFAYATDVRIAGPIEAGKMIRIGPVEGKILRSNNDGVYVKVAKEDLKFENHGDRDLVLFAERYHDKDWDRRHVLLFIPLAIINAPEEQAENKKPRDKSEFDCYILGKQRAKSMSTSGSSMGGFAGGVFLGLIGLGLAVALQGDPSVPPHVIPEEEDCQLPFIQGFQEEGRSRKRSAALTGGLVGTAALVVLVLVTTSSN